MIEVEGVVVDIRYRNEENYYSVFTLDTSDGTITVVGKIISLAIGDDLLIQGNIVYHDQYGEQIQLQNFKKMMPQNALQIEKYLASGIIPFIGKKMARDIVKEYGDKALDILTEDPTSLLKIKGIGKKKMKAIHKALIKEKESRNILIYLQGLGMGNRLAIQIYQTYGDMTVDIIEKNPYKLIEDIKGIGFAIADNIAMKNGLEKNDLFRINAGVVYYLTGQANVNGNCFVEKDLLLKDVSSLLGVSSEAIDQALTYIEINSKIKVEVREGRSLVYLRSIYDEEKAVVSALFRLLMADHDKYEDLDLILARIEEDLDLHYTETQKKAVLEAVNEKVMIITGGPGTGKTTIIRGIIGMLDRIGLSFYLCAPTGRAAKRMEESTGYPASTIHRLLGYKSGDEGKFLDFNEENPLVRDVIIVDECSMIDIYLMANLVRAIANGTKLILVGDVDQLPSVGPGNVLMDLINSSLIKTVRLDRIFRQQNESNIVKNAHLINEGALPVLNERDKDFFFIRCKNDLETAETLVDLVAKRLPSHYKVDAMKDIQVLTPMKKGPCGVDELNKKLQAALNPPEFNKDGLEYGGDSFREGDKVMQIKNNYDLETVDDDGTRESGVYNGDIGFIRNIFQEDSSIEVVIDKKRALYQYKLISELKLSYAITIHKSQGSEFPIVVIPMARAPYMLLTRNLLYTGITRAKSLVVLVGDEGIMRYMIGNNFRKKRNSSLDLRFRETLEKYKSL